MCWSVGRSRFMLDCFLRGKSVRKRARNRGLRLSKESAVSRRRRTRDSVSAKRMEECFMSKGLKLIERVENTIRTRITFEYLLVDSWLTCTELWLLSANELEAVE